MSAYLFQNFNDFRGKKLTGRAISSFLFLQLKKTRVPLPSAFLPKCDYLYICEAYDGFRTTGLTNIYIDT
jgi:hypothetical protein